MLVARSTISDSDNIFIQARFDVNAANGAMLVGHQPLVDAVHVEQMHARQAPHIVLHLEQRQANCALLAIVLVDLGLAADALVFVRECIPFNGFLCVEWK